MSKISYVEKSIIKLCKWNRVVPELLEALEGKLVDLQTTDKPAMTHTCNPNILVVEAAELDSQGQHWLPSKFEANLTYNRRPCF